MLLELEGNCTGWVLSFVKDQSFETMINDPIHIYAEIAKGLLRHEELLRLLFASGVYSELSNHITSSIKDVIWDKCGGRFREDFVQYARLILDFMTAGAVGIYDRMFGSDPAGIDDVIEALDIIFTKSDIKSALKEGLAI